MPIAIASSRGILTAALVWLAVAGLAAAEFGSLVPASIGSWALFVVVAPPLYVIAHGVAEWAWSSRFGRFVAEHPSRLARITMGVIVGSAGMAMLWLVWWAADRGIGGAGV